MEKVKTTIGFYRGFEITETIGTIEQSDLEIEIFDFIRPAIKVGETKKSYAIAKIGGDWNSLTAVKKYIDRIMAKETFDDNKDNPADYYNLSYCINPDVTCDNCSYVSYNRDCKNNKVL